MVKQLIKEMKRKPDPEHITHSDLKRLPCIVKYNTIKTLDSRRKWLSMKIKIGQNNNQEILFKWKLEFNLLTTRRNILTYITHDNNFRLFINISALKLQLKCNELMYQTSSNSDERNEADYHQKILLLDVMRK